MIEQPPAIVRPFAGGLIKPGDIRFRVPPIAAMLGGLGINALCGGGGAAAVLTLIPGASGTIISSVFDTSLSAAFDGSYPTAFGSCAHSSSGAGTAKLGKDWGSGVTKIISRFRLMTPSNFSDFCSGGGTTTLELHGSTDNFSSSNVTLWTGTTGAPGTGTWVDVTSGITVTIAYRYHRVELGTAGGGSRSLSELEFYEYV